MSRIGKKPIEIPPKLKVSISAGTVLIEGPKGKMSQFFRPEVALTYSDADRKVRVERKAEDAFARAYHGTARALVANMVKGVTDGFERALSIVGVGYKAELKAKKLFLTVGFSAPVEFAVPDGLTVEVPEPTRVIVKGVDKQRVGEFSARVRKVRPPEPYKGKGIRYHDEKVVKKAGKSFGTKE